MDAQALSIDQITSVDCGKEEDENVVFDYKQLENNIDYEVTRQGDIISIQVMKELDTGYVYHFNVHTLLDHGKGEKTFKTIIHPRGINFIENHLTLRLRKTHIMRPENVQIVGLRLNTISSYYLIFIKNDLTLKKALKMLSNEPKTTF